MHVLWLQDELGSNSGVALGDTSKLFLKKYDAKGGRGSGP